MIPCIQIERWLSPDQIKYSEYWNNIGNEDFFSIESGDFTKFENHISNHGFINDFERSVKTLNKLGKNVEGKGIELAAGSLWLTSYILKNYYNQIVEFYALEMSESLLLNLGPKVLKHYDVNPDKLKLCIGSFYEINLPDESLDFVVMCQAFHHADNPKKLLKELYRILKKGGVIIMIGDIFISRLLYLKCYINYIMSVIATSRFVPKLLKKKSALLNRLSLKDLRGEFQDIYFPPHPQLGDHYHLKKQYEFFFKSNSFRFVRVKSSLNNHLSYILIKD
jgi:ubiquinone/menaquinone biosynthesis C-methylase UbiE